jgi:hypothetical protein
MNGRTTTGALIALAGFLLVFLPEQAEGRTKSKRGHHHHSPSGQAANGKTKSKKHVSTCVASYNRATELIAASQVDQAKESLAKCQRKTCGRNLRRECTTLAAQLKAGFPSGAPVLAEASLPIASPSPPEVKKEAVPQAADPQSTESEGVGRQIAKAHEAQAAEVEEPDSEGTASRAFTHNAAARKGTSEGGSTWPIYALGGVGVLALGTAGLFTYWGRQDNNTLLSSCAPDCDPASVHHIRMLYLAADVSIGIGVVALAASTWLYLRSPGSEQRASTRMALIRSLDVQTTSSGAFATVGGVF